MPGIGVQAKEYKVPSRSYGITAEDAANVLITAEEIKMNKPLLKAAKKHLKDRKKATEKIL
jgi:hypothetical protein